MRRLCVSLLACLVLASACAGERPTLDESASREVPVEANDTTTTETPAEKLVVRLAVPSTWSLDPADAGPASLTNRVLADLLYEGLTTLDDDGVVQPALASHWFVSDDRLTWTFVVDDNAVDGEGEPFSARDIKQSLERVAGRGLADQAASALTSISGWSDFAEGATGGVAGISAPDATTLVIQLDAPDERLLEILASPAYGTTGEDGETLRTSGEYRITDDPNRLIAVSETNVVGAIELVSNADGPAAAIAAGEADWAVLPLDASSNGLDADIIRQPLDMQVALVARHSTDDERLGMMTALSPLLLAADVPGLTARAVPATAGEYDTPQAVVVDIPSGDLRPLGEAAAAQLADLGVDVDTVVSEPGAFAARIVTGDAVFFPVIVAGGTGAAGDVLRMASPGGVDDVFGPESEARAALAAAVRAEQDLEQRALFADALERALIDDGLLLPIGRFEVRVALSHQLDGLRHRPDGTLDLTAARLADDEA